MFPTLLEPHFAKRKWMKNETKIIIFCKYTEYIHMNYLAFCWCVLYFVVFLSFKIVQNESLETHECSHKCIRLSPHTHTNTLTHTQTHKHTHKVHFVCRWWGKLLTAASMMWAVMHVSILLKPRKIKWTCHLLSGKNRHYLKCEIVHCMNVQWSCQANLACVFDILIQLFIVV